MSLRNKTNHILNELKFEIANAREKYPSNEMMMTALSEHTGKTAQALIDKPAKDVRKEALKAACVAIRIATEGDESAVSFRANNDLDQVSDIKDRTIQKQQVIVAAACRLGDAIFVGARHGDDVMNSQFLLIPNFDYDEVEEGFIDNNGRFYDRKQAMKIAKDSLQSIDIKRNQSKDELFSEGLY